MIHTTTKGNDFIVEVEVLFTPDTPIADVIKLQENMANDFREKYKSGILKLHLIEDKGKV